MSGWMKRNALPLSLAGVLILGGSFVSVNLGAQSNGLTEQEQHIATMSASLTEQAQRTKAQTVSNAYEALGASGSRITADRQTIAQMLSIALSWDSGDSYEQVRETLTKRYKLAEDSAFLTKFMPPATFNQTSDGARYYYLDGVGLNSNLSSDGVQTEFLSANGVEYRYAVIADVVMSSDTPVEQTGEERQANPSVTRSTLLYVSTNAEGKILDIEGIPATGVTRHS